MPKDTIGHLALMDALEIEWLGRNEQPSLRKRKALLSGERMEQLLRTYNSLEEPYDEEFVRAFSRKLGRGFKAALTNSAGAVTAMKESERTFQALWFTNKATMRTVGGLDCSLRITPKKSYGQIRRGCVHLLADFKHFRLLIELESRTWNELKKRARTSLFRLITGDTGDMYMKLSVEGGKFRLVRGEIKAINESLSTGTDIRIVPLLSNGPSEPSSVA